MLSTLQCLGLPWQLPVVKKEPSRPIQNVNQWPKQNQRMCNFYIACSWDALCCMAGLISHHVTPIFSWMWGSNSAILAFTLCTKKHVILEECIPDGIFLSSEKWSNGWRVVSFRKWNPWWWMTMMMTGPTLHWSKLQLPPHYSLTVVRACMQQNKYVL